MGTPAPPMTGRAWSRRRRARSGARARLPGVRRSGQARRLRLHDRGLCGASERRPRTARRRAGAHRPARLRRPVGPALGHRPPRCLRQHDACRYRGAARLPLAHPGQGMARARPRRAVLRGDEPHRYAVGAEARAAQPAARGGLRALLQGEQGQGHAAGDPTALPGEPGQPARGRWPLRSASWTGRPWSSGAPTTPTSRSSRRERQKQTFAGAEVVVLKESGHWPMWDAPAELEAAIVPFLARRLGAA